MSHPNATHSGREIASEGRRIDKLPEAALLNLLASARRLREVGEQREGRASDEWPLRYRLDSHTPEAKELLRRSIRAKERDRRFHEATARREEKRIDTRQQRLQRIIDKFRERAGLFAEEPPWFEDLEPILERASDGQSVEELQRHIDRMEELIERIGSNRAGNLAEGMLASMQQRATSLLVLDLIDRQTTEYHRIESQADQVPAWKGTLDQIMAEVRAAKQQLRAHMQPLIDWAKTHHKKEAKILELIARQMASPTLKDGEIAKQVEEWVARVIIESGGSPEAILLRESCPERGVPIGGDEASRPADKGGETEACARKSIGQVRVHIRWMIRRDMPEVLAIEHASFEYPWCEEEFLRVLRQRNCIGKVAELGERVVGFMIYELHKAKLQVLNIAVTPEFRRQGVGGQMMGRITGKPSGHRRSRVVLHVRETALKAQAFFKARGFRATGIAREHYEDTGEDAYMMQCLRQDDWE